MKTFKELIYAKYETQVECAKALGWPRQRLNHIVQGRKSPSLKDIDELSCALDISRSDMIDIFLPTKYTE